jgi:hypothetical protein
MRRHCEQAARIALRARPVEQLAQGEKPRRAGAVPVAATLVFARRSRAVACSSPPLAAKRKFLAIETRF